MKKNRIKQAKSNGETLFRAHDIVSVLLNITSSIRLRILGLCYGCYCLWGSSIHEELTTSLFLAFIFTSNQTGIIKS